MEEYPSLGLHSNSGKLQWGCTDLCEMRVQLQWYLWWLPSTTAVLLCPPGISVFSKECSFHILNQPSNSHARARGQEDQLSPFS